MKQKNLNDRDSPWLKNLKIILIIKTRFLKHSFITVITIVNYIFVISKTCLTQKLNKPKENTLKCIS